MLTTKRTDAWKKKWERPRAAQGENTTNIQHARRRKSWKKKNDQDSAA